VVVVQLEVLVPLLRTNEWHGQGCLARLSFSIHHRSIEGRGGLLYHSPGDIRVDRPSPLLSLCPRWRPRPCPTASPLCGARPDMWCSCLPSPSPPLVPAPPLCPLCRSVVLGFLWLGLLMLPLLLLLLLLCLWLMRLCLMLLYLVILLLLLLALLLPLSRLLL
jgi:hypothetical protein